MAQIWLPRGFTANIGNEGAVRNAAKMIAERKANESRVAASLRPFITDPEVELQKRGNPRNKIA